MDDQQHHSQTKSVSDQPQVPAPGKAGSDFSILVADVVSAYVTNNSVPLSELPSLIGVVHEALLKVVSGQQMTVPVVEKREPAVPIKKSVTPDYIISLEDGRRYKSLKRHLNSTYGMTPDAYRQKWGLPNTYPMVAPNYAAERSRLAKEIGLGSKRANALKSAAQKVSAPVKRGRPPKKKAA